MTLGPLTNVALALQRKPDIAAKVGRCVVMGGAPCCEGNVTPAAEYNIWCDPEAARIVLHSGLPVELVGWHLCRGEAALNPEDIKYVLSLGTPQARFAIECNSRAQQAYFEQTGERGISLPDPVAMSIALDPAIVTQQTANYVDVETSSELTLGMTVVDRLNVADNDRNRAVWAPILDRGEKADPPEVDAEHRNVRAEKAVQCAQHRSVAPEDDGDVGVRQVLGGLADIVLLNLFPITVFYLMGAIRCYAPIGRNICPSLGWPPGRRTEGCHDDIYR